MVSRAIDLWGVTENEIVKKVKEKKHGFREMARECGNKK